jgi:uncharacterized delta-60 repeat protein
MQVQILSAATTTFTLQPGREDGIDVWINDAFSHDDDYAGAPSLRPELVRTANESVGGNTDPLFAAFTPGSGRATTDFGAYETGSNVALRPDGKIVVAGSSGSELALARYNPDGSLDTSFGTGGKITGGLPGSYGVNVVLRSDGKILLGRSGPFQSILTRYDPDGTLDAGFGVGGDAIVDIGQVHNHGVAVRPDGKILLAGGVSPGITFAYHISVARLNSDGSLDTTFGPDGKVTTQSYGIGRSVIPQPDDKIVVAGRAAINPTGGADLAVRLIPLAPADQHLVGGRLQGEAEAEEAGEGGGRGAAAVEAEHELVEVALQVLGAQAVVGAPSPAPGPALLRSG